MRGHVAGRVCGRAVPVRRGILWSALRVVRWAAGGGTVSQRVLGLERVLGTWPVHR